MSDYKQVTQIVDGSGANTDGLDCIESEKDLKNKENMCPICQVREPREDHSLCDTCEESVAKVTKSMGTSQRYLVTERKELKREIAWQQGMLEEIGKSIYPDRKERPTPMQCVLAAEGLRAQVEKLEEEQDEIREMYRRQGDCSLCKNSFNRGQACQIGYDTSRAACYRHTEYGEEAIKAKKDLRRKFNTLSAQHREMLRVVQAIKEWLQEARIEAESPEWRGAGCGDCAKDYFKYLKMIKERTNEGD